MEYQILLGGKKKMINKFILAISTLNAIITAWFISKNGVSIVPIHFNINGIADRWGNKWTLIIFALIPVILSVCFEIYRIATKKNKNVQLNKNIENRLISIITVLFIFIGWALIMPILSSEQKIQINIFVYIVMAIGAVMIYISSLLTRIKQNRTFGIRTVWTLKNETVWNKTHKIGAYTGMIGGFVILIFGVFSLIIGIPWICLIGLGFGVLIATLIPIIYSYKLYKKINIQK